MTCPHCGERQSYDDANPAEWVHRSVIDEILVLARRGQAFGAQATPQATEKVNAHRGRMLAEIERICRATGSRENGILRVLRQPPHERTET